MYPWISRTLDFWLQFCEKKCGLYIDVYGNLSGQSSTNKSATKHFGDLLAGVRALKFLFFFFFQEKNAL